MKYAIVDIETTGLRAGKEKITEIAIYLHNGKEVTGRFSTLVNPEKKIPYRITRMTGINDRMVEDAPKFYEIAKKIVEFTEEAILVGHNVRFDYSFIRHEFLSLGYEYRRQTIDTVKLARKLIPGQPSYSLGKLCKALGIDNRARHRADGDALATVKLFELLLSMEKEPENLFTSNMAPDRNRQILEPLPHAPGVYYFYNKHDELIYIGKSIDIHARVQQHLTNNSTKKALEMKNNLYRVEYTLTGNELVALLLESAEIKRHRPLYNRTQLRSYFNYGLYSFIDKNGYNQLTINRIINSSPPLYTYSSLQEGKEHLTRITEKFGLCQKLTGLYKTEGACFYYQIHQCNGACIGKEPPGEYNMRVEEAITNYYFDKQNFLIIDKGRDDSERSVVKVMNGKYEGFGFISSDMRISALHDVDDFIKPQKDNKEVRRLIIRYLKQKKKEVRMWYF